MKNEERKNEAEVRHQSLLVILTEIGDDRQVRRQKLRNIGKDFVSDYVIYIYFSVCTISGTISVCTISYLTILMI